MNIWKLKIMALAVACTFGLVACDKPHPAEHAGKEIDEAAEKAGEKMDKASEKISDQTAKAGVALEDAAITTKVKAAILGEPGLKSLDIKVDTVGGVVTLTGKADSQANSDKAKLVATTVSEVKQVNNQLEIK
jgi:osmotically-inducible protein OsmY